MGTVDITELLKLRGDLERLPPRVGAGVSAVIRKDGARLKIDMAQRAPKLTGALASSVTLTTSGNGNAATMTVDVEATERYARFQEWGTSRMPPQEFAGPAYEAIRQPFIDDVTDAALRALDG